MSLKDIEEEIGKQGEQEIRGIDDERKKAVESIRREIKNAADAAYEQAKLKKSREYEIELKRIVSDARMMKKNRIAMKKAEMLDAVFADAEERILKMNEMDKKGILENLVKDKGDFPNSIVRVDKRYLPLLKDAKPSDINDFGIIIESKDGYLRIDRTLPKLIIHLRTRLEPEIVKILFR